MLLYVHHFNLTDFLNLNDDWIAQPAFDIKDVERLSLFIINISHSHHCQSLIFIDIRHNCQLFLLNVNCDVGQQKLLQAIYAWITGPVCLAMDCKNNTVKCVVAN